MHIKTILASAAIGALPFLMPVAAHAVPITYSGALLSGVTVTDDVSSSAVVDSSSSALVDYWSFSGIMGATVDITARRLEGALDVAFWLFHGTFADDSVFAGGAGAGIDTLDAGFIAFGDDELLPFLPGPFGDSFVSLALPTTGQYSIIVTSFLSGADDGDDKFPYNLTINGNTTAAVPLPAALPLLAIGLGALGAFNRRRRHTA